MERRLANRLYLILKMRRTLRIRGLNWPNLKLKSLEKVTERFASFWPHTGKPSEISMTNVSWRLNLSSVFVRNDLDNNSKTVLGETNCPCILRRNSIDAFNRPKLRTSNKVMALPINQTPPFCTNTESQPFNQCASANSIPT